MSESMTMDTGAAMLTELREIHKTMQALFASSGTVQLPADAKAAAEARATAIARGYHTIETFAAATGMHPREVSRKCKARVIRVLPSGTKRYHIPLTEERRINGT